MHHQELSTPPAGKLTFQNADLEIRAHLGQSDVTIDVMKAGTCVHRLTLSDAMSPLQHSWLAELFAREDKVDLGAISRDADDYVSKLDINQG